MTKKNQRALNTLKKFNVIIDKETEKAVLNGMISVTDVLREYGKECCEWVRIWIPSSEYTTEEQDFFDKFIYNLLNMGKEKDVVIDWAEDKDNQDIVVQVKHKDLWNDFQQEKGLWADLWYNYYLNWNSEKEITL